MMNRYGFGMIEMLAYMGLLGIILCMGLFINRGTLAMTLTQFDNVSDNDVYDAAIMYAEENNNIWIDNTYTCVTVDELVDYGYFDYNDVSDIREREVKVIRNSDTLIIEDTKYVDNCE